MTGDYLTTALAFATRCDKSDKSDRSTPIESPTTCDISDQSDRSTPTPDLLSHMSLMSQQSPTPPADLLSHMSHMSHEQENTGRQCVTCRNPLPADRIEQCRSCSAAALRRMNPAVADEIYGTSE